MRAISSLSVAVCIYPARDTTRASVEPRNRNDTPITDVFPHAAVVYIAKRREKTHGTPSRLRVAIQPRFYIYVDTADAASSSRRRRRLTLSTLQREHLISLCSSPFAL